MIDQMKPTSTTFIKFLLKSARYEASKVIKFHSKNARYEALKVITKITGKGIFPKAILSWWMVFVTWWFETNSWNLQTLFARKFYRERMLNQGPQLDTTCMLYLVAWSLPRPLCFWRPLLVDHLWSVYFLVFCTYFNVLLRYNFVT